MKAIKYTAIGLCVGLVFWFGAAAIGANVPGMSLARGYIFRGNASGVARPYDANDNGKILIGDGNDLNSVAVTGRVAITNAGVTSLAANAIVSSDIDKNVIQVVNLQLTNAQVMGLRGAAQAVTAVPGANTAYVVDLVEVVSDDAGGAWTETADDLVLEYSGGVDIMILDATQLVGGAVHVAYYYPIQVPTVASAAGTACSTTCVGSGTCLFGIDSDGNANGSLFKSCSDAASDSCVCMGAPLVPTAAQAIQLKNIGDGEWGGGNAADTFSIRLWYHQVSTVAFSTGG